MMWLKVRQSNIVGIALAVTLICRSQGVVMAYMVFLCIFISARYLIVMMAQAEEVGKSLFCRRRFYSRKWLNNLIHDI